MSIEQILIEIEEDFKSYFEAGLIDRASLLRWGKLALGRFGQSILTKQEDFVIVDNGVGNLSENFHSLHYAVKCTPSGYDEEAAPVLQNSIFWKERTERSHLYLSCEPCCQDVEEKTIVEKIYMDDNYFNVYYSEPTPLRLRPHIIKSYCAKDCKNVGVQSEYEISINNSKLHTNFKEGVVYMQYYGYETDEDGYYMIPETPRGELALYIEAHLKSKVLERVLLNGDDKNVGSLLEYQKREEMTLKAAAIRDVRYKTLTPQSYAKIARLNKYNIQKYEVLLPRF